MIRQLVRIGSAVALASVLGAAGGGAQVAELQVFPASVTLAVGQREEVLASAYSASGDYLSTVQFRWTQTAQSIVRIESDPASPPGVFYLVGVAPGTAELRLTAGDRSESVSVTVSGAIVAAGEGVATILQVEPAEVKLFPLEQVQLQPRFLRDDGALAAYSPLTWVSMRPDVATVDQSGVISALDTGRTIVEAKTERGLSRRVLIEVTAADWEFDQSEYLLAPMGSDTVRAVVPSQGDRLLDPRQFVAWRSTNPNVVTISPVGEITGMSAGTAQVEADGFGRTQRATVRVHPTVEEIVVRPRPGDVLVPLGGAIELRATALAADSTPVPEATLHWHIRDTTVASFDADSLLLHGREIGGTVLTMNSPGFADAIWTVHVSATGLVVAPRRLGIGLDDNASLAASFADSAGITLAPARAVMWSTSNPDVVRVRDDGTLDPVGFGSAEVMAFTPWGVGDTALVFVQGAIVVTSTREGTADLFAFDPQRPSRINPITSGPGDDLGAAFSPDGSRIAFASNRDGNFEIYVTDADGGNVTRLTTTTANETEPTWGPDGTWLAYQSDASGAPQIWSMRADGSDQRPLTEGPANMEPAVSPDGRAIAFSTIRDGNYEVYLMAPDGSEQRNVSRNAEAHERVPGWIDAGTLAYVREERTGRSATWVVVGHPLDGMPQPLTQPDMVVNDFTISPDGATLAIASEEQGPSGRTIRAVYLVPVGGGLMTEVPRQDEHDQIVRPAFRR
jgi:WD40 repeat protein